MNARLRTAALVNLAMVVEQANEQVRRGLHQQQQEQGCLPLSVQLGLHALRSACPTRIGCCIYTLLAST
jgi:hypothetical protein